MWLGDGWSDGRAPQRVRGESVGLNYSSTLYRMSKGRGTKVETNTPCPLLSLHSGVSWESLRPGCVLSEASMNADDVLASPLNNKKKRPSFVPF